MKKLLFVFATMFCFGLVSCWNKTDDAKSVNDSDTVVVDTLDSARVDSVK